MLPLAILDLTEQVEIDNRIPNLAYKLKSPKLNVYKAHFDRLCNSLNVSKISENNKPEQTVYLSEAHICLEENWNQAKSVEKTQFSVISDNYHKLFIDTSVVNDCGQCVGFNSQHGLEGLGNFTEKIRLLHINDHCSSECLYKAERSSSQAVRELCPICLQCRWQKSLLPDYHDCTSDTRVCGSGNCFKHQLDKNQSFDRSSLLNSIELYEMLFGAITFLLLILVTRMRSKTVIFIEWILFIKIMFDLVMSWLITTSFLLSQLCMYMCPIGSIIRYDIWLTLSLPLWTKPFPPLTLKRVLYMSAANIITGIVVTVYNYAELERSCNNLKQSDQSTMYCGVRSRTKQHYYFCVIILKCILGVFLIIQANKNKDFKWYLPIIAFVWIIFAIIFKFTTDFTILSIFGELWLKIIYYIIEPIPQQIIACVSK